MLFLITFWPGRIHFLLKKTDIFSIIKIVKFKMLR